MVALVLLISSRTRSQKSEGGDEIGETKSSADEAFYKSQIKALENDKETGLLDDEQFRVARAELAREALASQKK